ncbi:hypothetical protein D3C72_1064600 [compost metagenome]
MVVGHQHYQALGAKRQRYHPLAGQNAVVHPDLALVGHHHPQHIHTLVFHQLQVDFRVVHQKRPQYRRQQCTVGHSRGRQAQGDAVLARQLLQGFLQLVRFTKHAACALQHQATGRRQLHATGVAGKQRQAAALFQQAQAIAGGRHRHREGRSRLAQAACGGNGQQQAQISQVERHTLLQKRKPCSIKSDSSAAAFCSE